MSTFGATEPVSAPFCVRYLPSILHESSHPSQAGSSAEADHWSFLDETDDRTTSSTFDSSGTGHAISTGPSRSIFDDATAALGSASTATTTNNTANASASMDATMDAAAIGTGGRFTKRATRRRVAKNRTDRTCHPNSWLESLADHGNWTHVHEYFHRWFKLGKEAIDNIVKHCPHIVDWDLEEDLEPRLMWLQQRLFVSDERLGAMLIAHPTLVKYHPEKNMEPAIQFVQHKCLEGSWETTRTFVINDPSILGASLEQRLQPRLRHYLSTGLAFENLRRDPSLVHNMAISAPGRWDKFLHHRVLRHRKQVAMRRDQPADEMAINETAQDLFSQPLVEASHELPSLSELLVPAEKGHAGGSVGNEIGHADPILVMEALGVPPSATTPAERIARMPPFRVRRSRRLRQRGGRNSNNNDSILRGSRWDIPKADEDDLRSKVLYDGALFSKTVVDRGTSDAESSKTGTPAKAQPDASSDNEADAGGEADEQAEKGVTEEVDKDADEDTGDPDQIDTKQSASTRITPQRRSTGRKKRPPERLSVPSAISTRKSRGEDEEGDGDAHEADDSSTMHESSDDSFVLPARRTRRKTFPTSTPRKQRAKRKSAGDTIEHHSNPKTPGQRSKRLRGTLAENERADNDSDRDSADDRDHESIDTQPARRSLRKRRKASSMSQSPDTSATPERSVKTSPSIDLDSVSLGGAPTFEEFLGELDQVPDPQETWKGLEDKNGRLPTLEDVICGRSHLTISMHWPGNRYFHKLLNLWGREYDTTKLPNGKKNVTSRVCSAVFAANGSFLEWSRDEHLWLEFDINRCFMKTAQAFRDSRKLYRRDNPATPSLHLPETRRTTRARARLDCDNNNNNSNEGSDDNDDVDDDDDVSHETSSSSEWEQ